jgi:hypothetical protein
MQHNCICIINSSPQPFIGFIVLSLLSVSDRRREQGGLEDSKKEAYVHISQVARYAVNVGMQEFIQNNHMLFFTKENVVREILYDLGDDHETPSDDATVIFGTSTSTISGANNGGRYEA